MDNNKPQNSPSEDELRQRAFDFMVDGENVLTSGEKEVAKSAFAAWSATSRDKDFVEILRNIAQRYNFLLNCEKNRPTGGKKNAD